MRREVRGDPTPRARGFSHSSVFLAADFITLPHLAPGSSGGRGVTASTATHAVAGTESNLPAIRRPGHARGLAEAPGRRRHARVECPIG
jgi:hypothetical protein